MRRLLVIAYFFPPLGGVGIQRTLRLVRHLPEIGWDAEVLTVGKSGYPYRDEQALTELPEGLVVHRVEAPDPEAFQRSLGMSPPGKAARKVLTEWLYPLLYVPDRFRPWAMRAELKARQLLSERSFDLVYASLPPFSAALPAVRVSRAAGVPVVLDFRDLWVASHYDPPHPLARGRQERLEREAVEGAKAVVTATDGLTASFRARYPSLPGRFTAIHNGFDSLELPRPRSLAARPEVMLVHAGSLYGGRDIAPLMDGMASLLRRRPELRIRLRLIGELPSRIRAAIEAARLSDAIVHEGRMTHAETLRAVSEADAVVGVQVPGLDRDAVPMKVYEAMGLRRPVLLLGEPEAESARILDRAGLLYLAKAGDPQSCEAALGRFCEDAQAGRLGATIDEDYVASFDMVRQIEDFREVFDRAAAGA